MTRDHSDNDLDVLFPGYDLTVALQQAFMKHLQCDAYRRRCPELGGTHPWTLVELSCPVSGEVVSGIVVCADPIPGGWDLTQCFDIYTGEELDVGAFRSIDPAQYAVRQIGTVPGRDAVSAHSAAVPLLNLVAVATADWSAQPDSVARTVSPCGEASTQDFPEAFVCIHEGDEERYGLVTKGFTDGHGGWNFELPVEVFVSTGDIISVAPGGNTWIELIHDAEPVGLVRRG
ncbi:hypothetical protein [Asaia bogorensis]|uniref:Uncharacterized protein n=1 Tax=Asaia bogorensis TaxID=91915 RepID=A0A060QI90_9PROT|nr:hypothetical protein [Asaia bogorensis]CDG38961.1 hypothetical protein ASAP_0916 [Asaia bogorensis]